MHLFATYFCVGLIFIRYFIIINFNYFFINNTSLYLTTSAVITNHYNLLENFAVLSHRNITIAKG